MAAMVTTANASLISYRSTSLRLPSELLQHLLDRADRSGGEPLGLLRVAGVGEHPRQRLQAAALAAASPLISTSAAAPSEIEEELAAVTVPSLAKAGFRVVILLMSQVPGVSSRAIDGLALAALDGHAA